MRVTVTHEDVVAAYDFIKDDPNFSESRKRIAQGQMPIEMMQAMSLRPEILGIMAAFSKGVYPGGLLERSLEEIVILESSRKNECQFCTASHSMMMKSLGIADDPIAYLDDTANLSKREQLALEYTRAAMLDSNRVPDSLFTELKEVFTDPEIVELTFLIGFINMLNLFNNSLRITYPTE